MFFWGDIMPSMISRILRSTLCAVLHSPVFDKINIEDSAGEKSKELKTHYKPSNGFSHQRLKAGDISYEKLVNSDCRTDKVIYLVHGGGFTVGLIDMYRKIAEKLSKTFGGATVYSIDYKTYPQHKFPVQLSETADVFLELVSQGINPKNVIFVGDSAGANLVYTSTLWLRDNGHPLPGAIVSFSTWGDMSSSSKSRETNAFKDPFSGMTRNRKVEDCLDKIHGISSFADGNDPTNPYLSPIFGDFTGFPPVTMTCSSCEIDIDDNRIICQKLKDAGVDAVLYEFEGQIHDFQFIPFIPEGKQAMRLVAERLGFCVKGRDLD